MRLYCFSSRVGERTAAIKLLMPGSYFFVYLKKKLKANEKNGGGGFLHSHNSETKQQVCERKNG